MPITSLRDNVVPLVQGKRFCVECRFYKGSGIMDPSYVPDRCLHPANGKDSPVYGHMAVTLPYGRDAGYPCGPAGSLWEPKKKPWWRRIMAAR